MGNFLFVSWDGDHVGRVISGARMSDDADELRKVSSAIDRGNQLWKDWAINHGGSVVSMGGDEGQAQVSAVALQDLQDIKRQYEESINSTVSIGIGMKLSESFKALLCSKLRGRNRTTFYDKDVEKEIQEASGSDDDTKKKIVDEYLEKRQVVHHTGKGGTPTTYHVQEASANPEIQQKKDLKGFKEQTAEDFETSFRQLATSQENKENSQKASKSGDLDAIKQKVATALEAVHKQLPQLAEIKQASPETYTAVLGVIQGLIALGQQVLSSDQQLSKSLTDKMPGGVADNMTPELFDQEQLAIGTMLELEHTDDPELAREIAMDHLAEDPDYYKDETKNKSLEKEQLSESKEELDPSESVLNNTILDKGGMSAQVKSIRTHRKLIPGEVLDSRHVVVPTPSGKNSVREVSAGQQRSLEDTVTNPVGPGLGPPVSARNKPSRT